jgi:hypothetical protein
LELEALHWYSPWNCGILREERGSDAPRIMWFMEDDISGIHDWDSWQETLIITRHICWCNNAVILKLGARSY